MLSTVLTVQVVGDHLRSGGLDHQCRRREPPPRAAPHAAIKAAVSNWTEGQATHFGTRGITSMWWHPAAAPSRGRRYRQLSAGGARRSPGWRLFLSTPGRASHHRQTMHVSNGALANPADIPAFARAKAG
jgi:NAD(P)-dependent dehydrogenase (short-subunit alcohol dehydrogenase family)